MANSNVSFTESFLKLHRLLRLDRRDVGMAFLMALLAGLVQLSLPLGIQSIISFVMAGSLSTSIVVLIAVVVFGVFANGLLQIRLMQLIEKVRQKIFVRFSLEYSDRIPRLDIERLDHEFLPETVNRYFDSVMLQKGIDKLLIDLPAAIIQVLLGLLLISFYHPIFIAFGLALIVIVILIIRFTSPQGLRTALTASSYKYEVAGWLQEIARTIKTFKYTKGTRLHMHRSDELVSHYLEARTSHFKILMTQFWSLITFKIVIIAAMLTIGTYLLLNQQINVGQFIAADIVIIAIIASIEKLITNLDTFYDSMVSMEKLGAITEAETEHSGHAELAEDTKGVSVLFEKVTFSYGDDPAVLKHVSFAVEPRQFVQFAGPSGSGKSTVLRLLTGAFKNYTGKITINDLPVENYKIASLRKNTGILLGNQDIFQASVWENLTMGNASIQLDEVNRFCELTGLNSFIQSLKKGYDTILMPLGTKLPYKVRKNILLIRALVGQPKLLLLEEPFEHLTADAKEKVINYIKNNLQATVLIASQDSKINPYCHQVINLSNAGDE